MMLDLDLLFATLPSAALLEAQTNSLGYVKRNIKVGYYVD